MASPCSWKEQELWIWTLCFNLLAQILSENILAAYLLLKKKKATDCINATIQEIS